MKNSGKMLSATAGLGNRPMTPTPNANAVFVMRKLIQMNKKNAPA